MSFAWWPSGVRWFSRSTSLFGFGSRIFNHSASSRCLIATPTSIKSLHTLSHSQKHISHQTANKNHYFAAGFPLKVISKIMAMKAETDKWVGHNFRLGIGSFPVNICLNFALKWIHQANKYNPHNSKNRLDTTPCIAVYWRTLHNICVFCLRPCRSLIRHFIEQVLQLVKAPYSVWAQVKLFLRQLSIYDLCDHFTSFLRDLPSSLQLLHGRWHLRKACSISWVTSCTTNRWLWSKSVSMSLSAIAVA